MLATASLAELKRLIHRNLHFHRHNDIVVFMIPALIPLNRAPWKVLPSGIHPASLSEVKDFFATNPRRRELFDGLLQACQSLVLSGCHLFYLDGSFVTGKPTPGDYDVCWDPNSVDGSKLDPVFLDFTNKRAKQKEKYLGEFFPFDCDAEVGIKFIDFFQKEKFSGEQKGIILIDLKLDLLLKQT